MLLYVFHYLFLITLIQGKKLHEHLTKDEIHSIFNVHHDDVHKLDYEVVNILHKNPNNGLRKRKARMANPQLAVRAFNQDYSLYLEENNNILLGENTPVFIAQIQRYGSVGDGYNIVYSKTTFPPLQNFKLYQDVANNAAISLDQANPNGYYVNGVIGHNIVIRSLPTRVLEEVLNKNLTRSKRDFTPHVAIQSGTNQNPYGLWNYNQNGYYPYKTTEDIVYPELLVTTDYENFEAHNRNIEETAKYMAAFWNAVDLRFRTMSYPKIRLNIAGLIIPMEQNTATYLRHHMITYDTVYSTRSVHDTGAYFSTHRNEFPLNTYDLIVGLSSKVLGDYGQNGQVNQLLGASTYQGICNVSEGIAVAIVVDKGDFSGIITAAHEIAHSLGAVHDGPESIYVPGGPCPQEEGHMMSYDKKDERAMFFSRCSHRAMQEFLRHPRTQCLRNVPYVGRPYRKILPGRLQSRDEQCRRSMGDGWFSYNKELHNCGILWCMSLVKSLSQVLMRPPAEGTSCGEGLICLNAACVKDPELP